MVMTRAPLPRLEGAVELLDRPDNSDTDVFDNLRDIERLNRYFGGIRTVVSHLARSIDARPVTSLELVDIGTGGADIPRAICRWARSRNVPLTVEALDRSGQVLAVARERSRDYPEIRLRRAEAPPLPYSDRSFDFAISSQLLHHLAEAEGVRMLREMRRVARRGVIVTDLVRSRRAYISTAIATRLLCMSRLTRNDAPVSVLRAYR
ncbi:MAG: methyltransferase domain-containing protein, partial [Candidatus Methylomirabilaceae bacterium]